MFGLTNFPVLLCNGQFWQISMVPTLVVFYCTLIINPARLFHNFQNVQWFVHCWMICNYDVKRILTRLNNLYCVEWFTLRWIICTNLNNLYLQRWICFDYVEKFAQLLNDFLLENIPRKIAWEFSLLWNPNSEHCPIRKTPCGNSSGNNSFATNEKSKNL